MNECIEPGTVIFDIDMRAELRVVGIDRIAFALQVAPDWHWVVLRDVETKEDVRNLCEALGRKMVGDE